VTARGAPANAPARGRVFYGWYIVAVATAGAFLAGGLTSQVFFSVMLKPLTEDMGWSRTEISGAITLGTLSGGLLSPIAGALVDRHGPRFLAPIGALLICVALLLIASVQSLVVFYVAFIVARSFSNVSMSGVVSQAIAVNWFRRMRGRVLGIMAMSVPLGGSLGAVIAQPIIDGPGWRTIFYAAPVLIIVTFVVPALLVYRRQPEDIGLLPDGASTVESDGSERKVPAPELSWTVSEAFRTKALWLLISAMFIGRLASGAVSFHLVAFYTDKGMSTGIAALAISLFALFGAIASFMWGFLIERLPERLLLVTAMLLSGISLMLMLPVQAAGPALALAALFGLAGRGEGTLVNTVLAQYYGRQSFGRIAGLVSPFNMAALGAGPLLASISFDLAGSYTAAFWFFIGSYLVAAFLLWLLKQPKLPARLQEEADTA
jgi:MFS transporter, OFA family, oxalate/formate antiporter